MYSNAPTLPGPEPGSPYPASPAIERLEWAHPSTIVRKCVLRGRDGSDNWPTTWADDDDLYTAYGDGYGFAPGTPEKLGLGFAKITGAPPDHEGVNIRSDAENRRMGESGKKASGMLMVGGVLHMWAFHADEAGARAQLAWSKDHARSWAWSDWEFEEFGLCAFINFGKNYAGARDEYVYVVSHDGPVAKRPADSFVLMRAPNDRIEERASFEFFKGLDANGAPAWTADINERGGVFTNPGRCLRSGISYCAPLRRYLWWQHIPKFDHPRGDQGDTRFEGGFGIYDAPEPWGPWTTVYHAEKWDVGPGERAEFPPKWMSADGRTLYLVFSGDDTFAVRKAALALR